MALWAGLATAWAIGVGPLSLIDLLLCLALLVVVPMALPLVLGDLSESRAFTAFEPAAAAAGVAALLAQPGVIAGILASAWLVLTAVTALRGVALSPVMRPSPLVALASQASVVFLLVGGAWLVASRLGWRPLGFSSEIVELTSVHFHYAGMASSLLAARALATLEAGPGEGVRAGRMAVGAIVVGPPIVAAGFTFSPALQVTGAVLITLGLITLAWLTLVRVVPKLPRGPWRPLLAVSAIAVMLPMLLAVDWALGQHLDIPSLSIPRMAAIHGSLNSIAFSGGGVLGWRLFEAARDGGNARPRISH